MGVLGAYPSCLQSDNIETLTAAVHLKSSTQILISSASEVCFSVCRHSHESAAALQIGPEETTGHQSSKGHRSTPHPQTPHQLPLLPVSTSCSSQGRVTTRSWGCSIISLVSVEPQAQCRNTIHLRRHEFMLHPMQHRLPLQTMFSKFLESDADVLLQHVEPVHLFFGNNRKSSGSSCHKTGAAWSGLFKAGHLVNTLKSGHQWC